jgi:peroxidase
VAVNNILRAQDGTGHLFTAPDGNIPFLMPGLANDCPAFDSTVNVPSSGSGDSRVDENPMLTMIHSLYFRNHNRIASWLKLNNPLWNDDQLFFKARDINIGAFQQQIYEEYLPETFLKRYLKKYLGKYEGYQITVDPRITSSSDIALRVAHSQLALPPYFFNEQCELIRINGTLGFPPQSRPNCIFSTFRFLGGKAIVQSALVQHAQILSGKINDLMRNAAFQSANGQNTAMFNLDIETLNIIRDREFRTLNLNGLRSFWVGESLYDKKGCLRSEPLDPIECFLFITNNVSKAEDLRSVYHHVDQIEAFIGLMFDETGDEDEFGEIASAIALSQFKRTRSADPNWYQIFPYTQEELEFVQESVADILENNFSIPNIQNAFRIQKQEKFC